MTPSHKTIHVEKLRAAERMAMADVALRWLTNTAFEMDRTPTRTRMIGDWTRIEADAAPLCFPKMETRS